MQIDIQKESNEMKNHMRRRGDRENKREKKVIMCYKSEKQFQAYAILRAFYIHSSGHFRENRMKN